MSDPSHPVSTATKENRPELGVSNRSRLRHSQDRVRDYETRPALQNLSETYLVDSTRDSGIGHTGASSRPESNTKIIGWMGLGIVLASVLFGGWALVGDLLLSSDEGPDVAESPASASTSEVTSELVSSSSDELTSAPASTSSETPDEDLMAAAVAAIDLGRVGFLPGTADLAAEGRLALADLAQSLLIEPDRPVEVVVRTFSEATPGENHGLSVKQAEVVLTELASHGVDPERVIAVGLGNAGTELPDVAGAVLFRSHDPNVDVGLTAIGPVVVDQPEDQFGEAEIERLEAVAELLADSPDAKLDLVGYAWSENDGDANHTRSHEILTMAARRLESAGVPANRMTEIGLGSIVVPLDEQSDHQFGVVEVETGAPAAISLALRDLTAEGVGFAVGTSELTNDGRGVLDQIAEVLSLDPNVMIEVAAHTYSEATSQANHQLSEQQGRAAVGYLVSAGIDGDRLRLVWHGDPPHFATSAASTVITFTVLR